MIAYKGFEPGLVCRGYQFVMGLNVTERANCAADGFHCAEDPLDCLTYYRDMKRSEYYLVEPGGDIDEDGLDSKIACTELRICRKLDREEFFLHALAYIADHPQRRWNPCVKRERGRADSGYAIVRGRDPVASGEKGDILALVKEETDGGKIVQLTMTCVDGERIKSGVWYDADLKLRKVDES